MTRSPGAEAAVLLMAYGAAPSLRGIPAYLADIRGGRPADPELVREIRERYRLMGGKSPLIDITRRQADALEKRLNARSRMKTTSIGTAVRFRCYIGMRHSPPTIREAVARVAREGLSTVVALPLTPFYSNLSVGAYLRKYEEAVCELGASLETRAAGAWHGHPLFIEAWAARVRQALERVPEAERAKTAVLFTAHSLPASILEEGDPYPRQVQETAKRVAQASGLRRYEFAYQSQGRTPEPWLGPDASEAIRRLAQDGARGLLLVPVGFVSDHMETLYDDDILYRGQAEALGMRYGRAASLNADPRLIGALAEAVRNALARG